ncbi:hypothetical protein OsJ_02223 [Oryza sativa Japonica Group]|uniref:Uncharacterized protein n=1 Tax=Oryza sativa subsp. japonica TaxID=39947 RepID=B9EXJ3_ORYSJ|nr:hypothetical protein OsJ_02223 [Oryza sativa Japonica Group]
MARREEEDLAAALGEPKLIWRAYATTAFAHFLIWLLSLPASASLSDPGPTLNSSPEKHRAYDRAPPFAAAPSSFDGAISFFPTDIDSDDSKMARFKNVSLGPMPWSYIYAGCWSLGGS